MVEPELGDVNDSITPARDSFRLWELAAPRNAVTPGNVRVNYYCTVYSRPWCVQATKSVTSMADLNKMESSTAWPGKGGACAQGFLIQHGSPWCAAKTFRLYRRTAVADVLSHFLRAEPH